MYAIRSYYGIEDTGVGIAPENLDKLFKNNAFTTVGTKNEKGTGLGLSICNRITSYNVCYTKLLRMTNILVIEDDRHIAELITVNLEDDQTTVHCSLNGTEGFIEATKNQYDLIILDLMSYNFV